MDMFGKSYYGLLLTTLLAITGCRAPSYFISANNVVKTAVTMQLLDGTSRQGLVNIALETNYYPSGYITIEQNGREDKLPLSNIRSYVYAGNTYVLKSIVLDYDVPERMLFVKRLTGANSKIHLYELFQGRQQRDDAVDLYMYFIELPQFSSTEAWGLGNKNLNPKFNEKMSTLVADCPALASKILQQENGYSFSQFTLSNTTKKDVLLKIIEAYNGCR